MATPTSMKFSAYDRTGEHVTDALFGNDLLGFSDLEGLFDVAGELRSSFVRWPGGMIADNDGGIHDYDLSTPNVYTTARNPRGLIEVLQGCKEHGQDLVMLAPTERFLSFTVTGNAIAFELDEAAAAASVRDFLLTLAGGARFGQDASGNPVAYDVPDKLVLQLGQEYYTGSLKTAFVNAVNAMDGLTITQKQAFWDAYVEQLGKIYGVMAAAIRTTADEIAAHPESYAKSFEVEVAVNMGRFQNLPESNPGDFDGSGSKADIDSFIAGIDAGGGLDAVDILLWQRYMPWANGITEGYGKTAGSGLKITDAVAQWELAAGRSFKVMTGTSIDNETRSDAARDYNASHTVDVTPEQLAFNTRSNMDFEKWYQDHIRAGAYGFDLPAAVVELMTELAGAGVDLSTAYSAYPHVVADQAGRLSATAQNDGTVRDLNGGAVTVAAHHSVLLAGGQMYADLADHIVGKQVVAGAGSVITTENGINVNAFRDADEMVLYVSATDLTGPQSVTLNLSALGAVSAFKVREAKSLNAEVIDGWQSLFGIKDIAEDHPGFDQSAEAEIYSRLRVTDQTFTMGAGSLLSFTLDRDYEVVRFTIDLRKLGDGTANLVRGTVNDDILTTFAANDTLDGLDGNDTLDGGAGSDRMTGGAGNDLYVVDAAGDVVTEVAGGGTDEVQTTLASLSLAANVEHLTYTGSSAFVGTGNELSNRITGGAKGDALVGGAGDDTLVGGQGNDTLTGGAGTDTVIIAGAGAATVSLAATAAQDTGEGLDLLREIENLTYVGEGTVTAYGNGANNRLVGGARNDTLAGQDGQDTLEGGTGKDSLDGGAGDDTLSGQSGDDTLAGGLGNDKLTGGEGRDTAVFTAAGGVTVTLATSSAQATGEGTDTLSEIENLRGGSGADRLTGGSNANDLRGEAGNDTINGGDGADTIAGGLGDDSLAGGTGVDTLLYAGSATATVSLAVTGAQDTGYGRDVVTGFENLAFEGTGRFRATGNAAANLLAGDAGGDTLDGGGGNDTLEGGAGDDSLLGQTGNDRLLGGDGDDTLDGGAGTDTAIYSGFVGATVSLAVAVAQETGYGRDVLIGVENLIGGYGRDRLTGSAASNLLRGGEDHDTLDGGAGNDTLDGGLGIDTAVFSGTEAVTVSLAVAGAQATGKGSDLLIGIENLTGGEGADTLTGDAGANRLDGAGGNDRLMAGAGDDTLVGGLGGDRLLGEDGNDRIEGGLDADLLFGGAGKDLLDGGDGDDRLEGQDGDDELAGGNGADTLVGGNGADTLVGHNGTDEMYGGANADLFVFNKAAQSPAGATHDVIGDFVSGEDRIVLSDLDADTALAGRQALVFSSGTARAHSVWTALSDEGLLLRADVNGDTNADFELLLMSVTHLAATDVLL